MLGQVLNNEHDQLIKSIEVGYLSMRANNVSIDNRQKTKPLEDADSAPEGGYTTTGILADLGGRRVYIAVITPVPKQPKHNLELRPGKSQGVLKAISDIVKFLIKKRG